MQRLLAVLFGVGLLLSLSNAMAIAVNPFNGSTQMMSLTKEDLALSGKAKDKAVAGNKVGRSAKWDNPNTGRSGTTTLTKLFKQGGKSCRTLKYFIEYKGHQNATFVMNECKQKNGQWMFE